MKHKLPPLLLFILIVSAFLMAACGSDDKSDSNEKSVSVQLSWVHNVEFVGFYEALHHDYYEEKGLDVTLISGGFDENGAFIDPIAPVVNGNATFGVTGADVLLRARADGVPIVAIAAIYQRSPVVLISLSDSGIINPTMLIGRRVSTQPVDSTVGLAYEALIRSQNLNHDDINETMRTDFTTNPLFNDESDVLAGFLITEGVQVRQNDPDANFILISDYGIDIYSNIIFTTEATIAENPNLIQDFLEATIRGIQHAVDNPNESDEYIIQTYGQQFSEEDKTIFPVSMAASLPLLNPARSNPGMMKSEVWTYAHQLLLDLQILDEPLDVEAAYNMTFLNAIYAD